MRDHGYKSEGGFGKSVAAMSCPFVREQGRCKIDKESLQNLAYIAG